jgi:hypothetical protein
VTDEGEVLLSKRMAENGRRKIGGRMLDHLTRDLLAGGGECDSCDYFDLCRGFFKQPRKEYPCEGVKKVFRVLEEAAGELKEELCVRGGQTGGEKI